MTMVEARDLTRRFGAVTAVNRLNLTVARGEVFGLVGPDGAGKTTTLRMFCGLLEPSSGEAFVGGRSVQSEAKAIKDRIGYMAQKFGLYTDLTVEENLKFYADLFGLRPAAHKRLMAELLAQMRMEPFRNRAAGKLSGGMKQKLALMCVLLHRPEILFLDEPTNGVDPVSRRDFWLILTQLVQQGMTVLLTTSYLDEAERCDRVALMDRGELICVDSPWTLRRSLRERCLEVRSLDLRATRDQLRVHPAVLSADLAGCSLHVLVSGEVSLEELGRIAPEAQFREILPSIEDIFIATIRGRQIHATP